MFARTQPREGSFASAPNSWLRNSLSSNSARQKGRFGAGAQPRPKAGEPDASDLQKT